MTSSPSRTARRLQLHPVLTMLAMIVLAVLLTHLAPAGKFDRHDGKVVAGTYRVVPKINGLPALFSSTPPAEADTPAKAAGLLSPFVAVPTGMNKSAELIFMVMFVGGMFGVLRATGALEAGVDRLMHLTGGNIYLFTAGLMLIVACGASFLGLYSEFLAIVPLVLLVGRRLQLPTVFSAATVILPAAIGYAASVTNPIVLAVAQPLAGVALFSGMIPRLLIFVAMFGAGLGYMLFHLRRIPRVDYVPETASLTTRQTAALICILIGAAALIAGTILWSWGTKEHAALFLAWALLLGLAGGLRAGAMADAFVDGMKLMLLPAAMIGLAGAMGAILQASQILDSVVQSFALAIEGHPRGVVVSGIMLSEMGLDVLIGSTGAKAAISLPILTPIAQLSGIGGNISVSALTLGGSLMNLITPTNGGLLAFLAASKVDYVEWARFIAPAFVILAVIAFAALLIMTAVGV